LRPLPARTNDLGNAGGKEFFFWPTGDAVGAAGWAAQERGGVSAKVQADGWVSRYDGRRPGERMPPMTTVTDGKPPGVKRARPTALAVGRAGGAASGGCPPRQAGGRQPGHTGAAKDSPKTGEG